jgi:hypothetical protein
MPDTLAYVPLFGVIALISLDTAITGKFRPFRNSKKNWPLSNRWRLLLAFVGVLAIGVVILLVTSKAG